jgi:hypothetical protein
MFIIETKLFNVNFQNERKGQIGKVRLRASRSARQLEKPFTTSIYIDFIFRIISLGPVQPIGPGVNDRFLIEVIHGGKSPGCPAAVFAAVGTIWRVSKLGGRKLENRLTRSLGTYAGSRPILFGEGRMTSWKKQVRDHLCRRTYRHLSSPRRFAVTIERALRE